MDVSRRTLSALGEVMVTTTLAGDEGRVLDASVIANVQKPNGEMKIMSLRDDGQSGDVFSADGVYTGIFTDTGVGGHYVVTSEATGVYNNSDFKKSDSIYFEVSGDGGEKKVYITSMLKGGSRSFNVGDTFDIVIYVENTGSTLIDDYIDFRIKDNSGKVLHKQIRPIYLSSGDSQFLFFNWEIPLETTSGTYRFRAELDDMDIETMPSQEIFTVG